MSICSAGVRSEFGFDSLEEGATFAQGKSSLARNYHYIFPSPSSITTKRSGIDWSGWDRVVAVFVEGNVGIETFLINISQKIAHRVESTRFSMAA